MLFELGDARLNARADWILDRMVAAGVLVLSKIGGDRAGEIAVHRFLDNDRVESDSLLEAISAKTVETCRGRRIVAAQDTTEVNFAGRDRGRTGLGPAGDGKSLGFFIHPVVAIDADDEAVIGVVNADIWTRQNGEKPDKRKRALEDKESKRWLQGAERAANRLKDAEQVVVVGDRESDIYSVFVRKPATVDLIVRAAHNRKTADGGFVFDASLPDYGGMAVEVQPKPGQKKRVARLRVSAGRVVLKRPRNGLPDNNPDTVPMTVVETTECEPPTGVVPLHWRLYTTLPVDSLAAAMEVVRLYQLRWRIEEVFRVLKSDGLDLENTQIEDRDRLYKLAALSLGAATRIMQLTNARDGSRRGATDAIAADLIEPVAAIGRNLEGKTERQRNPHRKGQLAWLSWIVARLGGWNCYYKPPGPKTMASGWKKLAAMIQGYLIATEAINV